MRCFALLVLALASPCAALVLGARPALHNVVAARSNSCSLRNIRCDEAPPPPPTSRLGATIDQDGKSNVWVR